MALTHERERLDTTLLPNGQQRDYLILSDEERAKGFVRPVRLSYQHVGRPGPKYPLVDLTEEQSARYGGPDIGFVKYEPYPISDEPGKARALGRFWTQADLDKVDKGCGSITTMGRAIAETYARQPGFYGGTFCCRCGKHLPVGADGEFVWEGTNERVGT
jgi:hypothetical protein